MAYCVPKGIPYSKFLAWSEDDQHVAIEYERLMRGVCGRCGTRAEDWQDDPFAYVGQHQLCPGCEVKGQEEENVAEPARPYTDVYLIPRHVAERLEAERSDEDGPADG